MDGMQEHAKALADAIEVALPAWVERCVEERASRGLGRAPSEELRAAAAEAGQRALAEVGPRVRALLAADIDEQATTPLSLLRGAARYPTDVLRAAGVPPPPRDEAQVRLLPDDEYDLSPASFADVAPDLADLAIAWGAAKAHLHLQRHRRRPA